MRIRMSSLVLSPPPADLRRTGFSAGVTWAAVKFCAQTHLWEEVACLELGQVGVPGNSSLVGCSTSKQVSHQTFAAGS